MAYTTQYIGSRYVPVFADPAEWNSTRTYEPLTIVLHDGNSYTSKQFVPVGIDITNDDYWAETGNYNAQIEQYRQEVLAYNDKIDSAKQYANNINIIQSPSLQPYGAFNNTSYSSGNTQGGCGFLIDTTEYVIRAYKIDNNNNPIITLVNTATNKTIVKNDLTYGHCNDMCFNETTKYIYILNNYTKPYQVGMFDTTLHLIKTFTLGANVWSLCYDPNNDVYYGMGDNYIYTFDTNFNVTKQVSYNTSNYVYQGMDFFNGMLYAPTNSNVIFIIDPNTGQHVSTMQLNIFNAEPEFIYHIGNSQKIGFQMNIENYTAIYTISTRYSSKYIPILANNTSESAASYNVTYSSNLYEKECGCLSQAVSISQKTQNLLINLSGSVTTTPRIFNLRYLIINGVDNAIIENTMLIQRTNCEFKNVTFNSKDNYALRYTMGTLTLTNCTINNDNRIQIYIYNANIRGTNSTKTSTAHGAVVADGNVTVITRQLVNCDFTIQYSNNTHEIAYNKDHSNIMPLESTYISAYNIFYVGIADENNENIKTGILVTDATNTVTMVGHLCLFGPDMNNVTKVTTNIVRNYNLNSFTSMSISLTINNVEHTMHLYRLVGIV